MTDYQNELVTSGSGQLGHPNQNLSSQQTAIDL